MNLGYRLLHDHEDWLAQTLAWLNDITEANVAYDSPGLIFSSCTKWILRHIGSRMGLTLTQLCERRRHSPYWIVNCVDGSYFSTISCASSRGETLPERTADLRGKRALVQFGSTSVIPTSCAQTSLTTPLRSEHYAVLLLWQDAKTRHESLAVL